MKLSEIKNQLRKLDTISFQLPDGSLVPSHFHVTEVGKITRHFIDCGGTVRHEEVANFQLWNTDDYDHRLHPEKLTHIIELSEKTLGLGDLDIEVEYQGKTIETYQLDFDGEHFLMLSKHTDCLAKEACNLPQDKPKINLADLTTNTCTPGSGCC